MLSWSLVCERAAGHTLQELKTFVFQLRADENATHCTAMVMRGAFQQRGARTPAWLSCVIIPCLTDEINFMVYAPDVFMTADAAAADAVAILQSPTLLLVPWAIETIKGVFYVCICETSRNVHFG